LNADADAAPVLETEELTRTFGDLVAVDGVDTSVAPGEFRSVIGPNGAGKSTLFDLITGLIAPTTGTVRFRGEEIAGLAPHEIAREGIARSFQITDVFGGLTAFENLRVAAQVGDDRRDSMWRRADSLEDPGEAADRVLDDIGLTEYTDQPASEFAYGDRRKLEIGLAVANDPELLLLDEPTAGMGREDTLSTIRMIRRLAEEREFTLMLIEHDLEIVMNVSDVVTVLQGGAVIAEGPPGEVREDADVKEAYIGSALQ
jgi:branched-chain amino acid transport system ATP-binding protein